MWLKVFIYPEELTIQSIHKCLQLQKQYGPLVQWTSDGRHWAILRHTRLFAISTECAKEFREGIHVHLVIRAAVSFKSFLLCCPALLDAYALFPLTNSGDLSPEQCCSGGIDTSFQGNVKHELVDSLRITTSHWKGGLYYDNEVKNSKQAILGPRPITIPRLKKG